MRSAVSEETLTRRAAVWTRHISRGPHRLNGRLLRRGDLRPGQSPEVAGPRSRAPRRYLQSGPSSGAERRRLLARRPGPCTRTERRRDDGHRQYAIQASAMALEEFGRRVERQSATVPAATARTGWGRRPLLFLLAGRRPRSHERTSPRSASRCWSSSSFVVPDATSRMSSSSEMLLQLRVVPPPR